MNILKRTIYMYSTVCVVAQLFTALMNIAFVVSTVQGNKDYRYEKEKQSLQILVRCPFF